MEKENRGQPELTNQGAQFTLEGGTPMDPNRQTEQQPGATPRVERGRRINPDVEAFTFDDAAINELNKVGDETRNINGFDLGSDVLKPFIETVNSLNPNNEADFVFLAKKIAGDQRIDNMAAKRLLYEMLVEKIISIPDPVEDAHYELSLYAGNTLIALKDKGLLDLFEYTAEEQRQKGETFVAYIGHLIDVRKEAHELGLNLNSGDNYKEFIVKGIKAHGIDVMRNEITGVSDVESLYELFSTLRLAERDTKTWFTEGDVRIIDQQVEDTIIQMVKSKKLIKEGRPLTEWEARRALKIGKTLFAGTQRFAMYAGLGDLPSGDVARVGSTPYEYIVRAIYGEKMAGARYFADAGSREFQKKAFAHMDAVIKGENVTLFGIGQTTWKVNRLGALTPADQRWRSQLMYLGSIKLNGVEGAPTLVDYLERQREQFGMHLGQDIGTGSHHEDYDPALGFVMGDAEEKKLKEHMSTEERADMILGQRLYLSNLVKFPMVTESMKADIWKKVAIFDPLAFSALLPKELEKYFSPQELALWRSPELRGKMARAALARLRIEGKRYKNGLDYETLKREADAFRAMSDGYKYQMIDRYFQSGELDEAEKEIIRKMINFGTDHASYMAKSNVPFTFAIDDAPHVAWEKTGNGIGGLGHENMIRILASDQANLAEAWSAINSLIEHPIQEKRGELFLTFIEKFSHVHGRHRAQEVLEPFIKSWIEMATMYDRSTFIGVLEKGMKIPRSDFEKFYRINFIAMDEEDRAAMLDGLAAMGIISSDVSEGKPAQLERLKTELKADRKYLAIKMFRTLLLLFGPLVAMEMIKLFFPDELGKSFGSK